MGRYRLSVLCRIKKTPLLRSFKHKLHGANDGARTRDIRDHNPTLYQAELHPPWFYLENRGDYTGKAVDFQMLRVNGA
jgi:hypothetical protein